MRRTPERAHVASPPGRACGRAPDAGAGRVRPEPHHCLQSQRLRRLPLPPAAPPFRSRSQTPEPVSPKPLPNDALPGLLPFSVPRLKSGAAKVVIVDRDERTGISTYEVHDSRGIVCARIDTRNEVLLRNAICVVQPALGLGEDLAIELYDLAALYQHGVGALLNRPDKLADYQVALADEAKVQEVVNFLTKKEVDCYSEYRRVCPVQGGWTAHLIANGQCFRFKTSLDVHGEIECAIYYNLWRLKHGANLTVTFEDLIPCYLHWVGRLAVIPRDHGKRATDAPNLDAVLAHQLAGDIAVLSQKVIQDALNAVELICKRQSADEVVAPSCGLDDFEDTSDAEDLEPNFALYDLQAEVASVRGDPVSVDVHRQGSFFAGSLALPLESEPYTLCAVVELASMASYRSTYALATRQLSRVITKEQRQPAGPRHHLLGRHWLDGSAYDIAAASRFRSFV
ncbi:uncharacterized protein PSANT_03032 [Moesziomyces antarcticus]|uniref:Uncharacterized protein n=1 Tax=Pseudozyma antarctica TaxID=84753 RepID=A0A5C3FMB6_PSEA2|nr:uncharacterized protein PSANT_03032 [Moesziomyces antarcticus]